MIDAAEGIASQWVRSLINPANVQQAVRDEILRTVPMLRRLPRHIGGGTFPMLPALDQQRVARIVGIVEECVVAEPATGRASQVRYGR